MGRLYEDTAYLLTVKEISEVGRLQAVASRVSCHSKVYDRNTVNFMEIMI